MVMELDAVQRICTVLTIGFFATGILTCLKIQREKSVLDVNFLPYVMTSLNCLLWTGYGLLINDSTLCFVNITGAALQLVYMGIYFKFLNNQAEKRHNMRLIGIAVFILMIVATITNYLFSFYPYTSNVLGITCDVFTILMFASPLSTLKKVIATKSTATLSLPLSIMVVLVSLSWFSYGTLINDLYVKVPNIIGAVLGLIQVSLFCVYSNGNKKMEDM